MNVCVDVDAVCNWFPAPSRGSPVRTWPGAIQGFTLHQTDQQLYIIIVCMLYTYVCANIVLCVSFAYKGAPYASGTTPNWFVLESNG